MYCKNCGYKNEDDAKFCEKCGNHLSYKGSPTSRGKSKKFKIALIVTILLIIAFAGIMLIGMNLFNQKNTTIENGNQTEHYSNNKISFNYPSSWTISNEPNSPNQVVMLERIEHPWSLLNVYVYENRPYTSEQLKLAARNNVMTNNAPILYEYYTNIDGERGYYIHSYLDKESGRSEQVTICYVKNNNFYALIFITQSYDTIKPEIDTVVNSFHAS